MKLKLAALIFIWFAVNVWYNIANKHILNILPLPWILSVLQLLVSCFYILGIWVLGLNPLPDVDDKQFVMVNIINGTWHLCVHFGAVVAFNSGNIAFVHIVKALEPVMTYLFEILLLSQKGHMNTLLPVITIVIGVALSSYSDTSWSVGSLIAASVSNIGSSLRSISCKAGIVPTDKRNNSFNSLACLVIASTIIGLPLAILIDGWQLPSMWTEAIYQLSKLGYRYPNLVLVLSIVECGLVYIIYNQMAFAVLALVSPVFHSIVNTMKRVVIVVMSIIVFSTPVSWPFAVGATLAFCGVYSYIENRK